MKYYDLKEKLQDLLVFTLEDIYLVDPEFRQPTLYDWEKKGQVVQLRRNRYVFGDFTPQSGEMYYLLANQIYQPSYVSLQLALNHYGVIPESVQLITSVTTRKTQAFSTPFGEFEYKSLNETLFFGYVLVEKWHQRIQIASLEKAILDYLYLDTSIHSVQDLDALRWNRRLITEQLDMDTFQRYLKIFNNQALETRVQLLKDFIQATKC